MATLPSIGLKSVKLGLPFGLGEVELAPDETERTAAWELYVELVTRIAVESLADDEGVLREALTSLHSLFGTTRQVLRAAGPSVGVGADTVGGIAIRVLNYGIRPLLAYWHPRLQAHERTCPPNVGAADHERTWAEHVALREALRDLRKDLGEYAHLLGIVAGVEHPRDTAILG